MKKIFASLLVVALIAMGQPVFLLAANETAKPAAPAGEKVEAPAAPVADAKAGDMKAEEPKAEDTEMEAGDDDAALLKEAAAALKATKDPKNAELAKKLEDLAADYEW